MEEGMVEIGDQPLIRIALAEESRAVAADILGAAGLGAQEMADVDEIGQGLEAQVMAIGNEEWIDIVRALLNEQPAGRKRLESTSGQRMEAIETAREIENGVP